MNYQIAGSTMQTLIVNLDAHDQVYTEKGTLLMMSSAVKLTTSGGGGGLGGMLARGLSGNSMFLNYYEATDQHQRVMFATRVPGHIVPFAMQEQGSIIVQQHALLCAEKGTEYKTAFTLKLGRFLGGNGLIFNQITGHGMAFVSVDGEVVEQELRAGETILVHPGHIAAYHGSITYEVQLMKGIANMLFGGDGLYLVRLTGPGHVWMHGFNIHNLQEVLGIQNGR